MQSQDTRPKVGDIIETAGSGEIIGEVVECVKPMLLIDVLRGDDVKEGDRLLVKFSQVARVWREVTR